MRPQCPNDLEFLVPITKDGKTISYWHCLNCGQDFEIDSSKQTEVKEP